MCRDTVTDPAVRRLHAASSLLVLASLLVGDAAGVDRDGRPLVLVVRGLLLAGAVVLLLAGVRRRRGLRHD